MRGIVGSRCAAWSQLPTVLLASTCSSFAAMSSGEPGGRGRHGGGRQSAKPNPLLIAKRLLVAVTSEHAFPMAGVIEKESNAESAAELINTLVACAETLPAKTSTYALIVGALAGKEATRWVASKVLLVTCDKIFDAQTRGDRLLLRFLGACIRACGIDPAPFIDVLENLLPNDQEDEAELNPAREMQVFSIISAIPWLASSAVASRCNADEDTSSRERILELCERLRRIRRPSALSAQLACLPRIQRARTDPMCDRLAMGLAMIEEGSQDWHLLQEEEFDSLLISNAAQLPRFGECDFPDLGDSLSRLKDRLQDSKRTAVTSPSHSSVNFTLLPLFQNDQPSDEPMEQQKKLKMVERFLVRERAFDIIGGYFPKVSEAADALIGLNSPYVVVESVFSAMLQMPIAEHTVLYYADVLVKLCEKAPTTVPAAIEDALDQILILEPENLDPDAEDRLAFWLFSHLLAYDLDWPWVKWRNVASMSPRKSVRGLVEQVLHRLDAVLPTRAPLEDPDKMVPKELLTDLLPVRASQGESSIFEQGSPHVELGNELVSFIKQKPTTQQLTDFLLERTPEPQWNLSTRTALAVDSALYAGLLSYTHTRAALERVGPTLNSLAKMDEDEERLIAEAALDAAINFWRSTPAWAVNAVNNLVDLKIVSLKLAIERMAARESRLIPYWRRRSIEDLLARASSDEERKMVIDAAIRDGVDESMDLWLQRRRGDA